MERLASTAELMDGPLDDRVALATNLRDLRRFNRLLGGIDLSRRALAALDDGGPATLTLLDVGTGAADIPAALLADARRTRDELQDHGDRQPSRDAAAAVARIRAWRRCPACTCGSATAGAWRTRTGA